MGFKAKLPMITRVSEVLSVEPRATKKNLLVNQQVSKEDAKKATL